MPPGKTVLICDDDQGMRDTIAAILKRDYNVLTVSSGEAALGLLNGLADDCAAKVTGKTKDDALALIPNTLDGILAWLGV